jgi:hypothetical protein
MKKKIVWLGMLVTALAFSMTVAGCDDYSEENDLPDDPTFGLMGTTYADSDPSGIRVLVSGNNATQYSIYYSDTSVRNSGYFEVAQANQGTAVYWFTDLMPNTTYYFWVRAMNRHGYSDFVGPKTASFSRQR